MNNFEEMIRRGEELVARTNEILARELDLDTAGTVAIATYVSDIKALHAETLTFTDEALAIDLASHKGDMDQAEYFRNMARFSEICSNLSGELRDRVYDRTALYDRTFNNKQALYQFYNEVNADLAEDIANYGSDLERIDARLGNLNARLAENRNPEVVGFLNEQIGQLNDERADVETRLARKNAELEKNRETQRQILNGNESPERTEDRGRTLEPGYEEETERSEEHEGPGVLPPVLPPVGGADGTDDELDPEPEDTEEHGAPGVNPPVGGTDGDDELDPEPEDTDEHEDDEEHTTGVLPPVLPPVGGTDGEDDELDPEPEDTDEETEEHGETDDGDELDPEPEDTDEEEEEEEVVSTSQPKPGLFRRIANIIGMAVAFLGSLSAITLTVDHFQNHHDNTPAEEVVSQNEEDDDKDNEKDEDDKDLNDDTDNKDNNDNQNIPGDDDNKDNNDDIDPNKPDPADPTPAPVNDTVVELSAGETVIDTSTGVEVTSDGSAYLHEGDTVTIQDDRNLEMTDHGTSIVEDEDLKRDFAEPTVPVTGEEAPYEEAVENMTEGERANLDQEIAEYDWEALFDQEYGEGTSKQP